MIIKIKKKTKINTLPLDKLGNEKSKVERGAAINVRISDPIKSSGRFDNPNEIAPSSRNGSTTKYALKICSSTIPTMKQSAI